MRKGSLVILLSALVGLGALGRAASAEDRQALAAPYLRALQSGAVGQVEGHAYGESRKASGTPTPYEGVSVLILPYTPDIDAQLDVIKAHQRDSIASYTDTHAEIVSVRTAYERDLLAAGGGELVRGSVADAAGVVQLTGVPEGEWILLGWREESHAIKGARVPPKDASRYPDLPVTTGYGAVSYWRTRISVRPGETTAVNLSDRGIWLTAVREEVAHPDAARRSATPKLRR